MEYSENISLKKLSSIGLLEKVKKELLKDEIIKNIKINKKEERIIIEKWCKKNSIKNEKEIKKWQAENILFHEDWMALITRELKWDKWCMQEFKDSLINYYHQRKPYLDKFLYSLIRVKNQGLGQELYLRIKNKESDFYLVAKEFSEGIEKKSGGLIGPVNLNKQHPSIKNILIASENNQLWPPKKINDWWVIIRLEKKIITSFNTELKIKLSRELGEKHIKKNLLNS